MITTISYFGYCNGDISFIISIYIIVITILIYLITKVVKNIKNNPYSYKNVRTLGLIIFISIPVLFNLAFFIYDYIYGYYNSINRILTTIQDDISMFLIFMLPIAFIITILIFISNIKLLRKEGKTWRNMLGVILGSFLCIFTISVTFLNIITIGVNYELYLFTNYFYNLIFMLILYFYSILLSTIIIGVRAAKKIPEFNKDYIIILGCKIRNDGTLTNLLKSRADRAIEFAKMQKDATGKDIIFVPSGGKGNDEVIAEGEAIKNYLLQNGISKEKILVENKSKNTYENIKFSNELIKNQNTNAKIAFSTTNYHVFRTGILATEQNLEMEGIGAKTKRYYWINAFIREFVATIVSEKKVHIKIVSIIAIIMFIFTLIAFLSLL